MKGIFFYFLFSIISSYSLAATINSVGNGNWEATSTWDCSCIPGDGDVVIIRAADEVTVSTNRNQSSDQIAIYISGILSFGNGKKLLLGCGSSISIYTGGSVQAGNSGNKVEICGEWRWQASSDGLTVTGPSTIDETGTNPGVPLPVELLYFNSRIEGDYVELIWSTASELNNDYFTLERSRNGKIFELLSNIGGNGTTSISSNYSYIDKDPYLGLSYYRLTQTDYDGQTEVFPIISVLHNPSENEFSVTPNPLKSNLVNIKSSGFDKDEMTELNIIDLQGKIVERKKYFTDQFGNLDIEYQTTINLQEGMYIFAILTASQKKYTRVIVE